MRTANTVMLFLWGKRWVLLCQKQKSYLTPAVLMADHLPWVPGLETSQSQSSQRLCAAQSRRDMLCLLVDASVVGWERHQGSTRVRDLQSLCL